jgi:peptide/nickel transport system permease protein
MGRFVDTLMSIPSADLRAAAADHRRHQRGQPRSSSSRCIYSPRVFRLTRAVAGNIVVMDYIEAAKLRGEGTWY